MWLSRDRMDRVGEPTIPEAVAPEACRHQATLVEHRVEHRRTPEPGAACHAESVHVRSRSVAWRGLFAAAAALLLAGCAADARTPSAAARARPTSTTSAP